MVPTAAPLIRLFGAPALVDAAGRVHPLPMPAGRLLAYLLMFPTPIGRERLAEALWPEQPEGYARRRLSDALYRLRRTIEPGWLVVTGTTIGLGPDLPAVDLRLFERLATSTLRADLEQAVTLYRADLLADFEAEWAWPRRLAVREIFLDCLMRLGAAAETAEPGVAAAAYRRLISEDPLREEAHQGLMRCLARNGRYVEALKAYSRLERTLDAELGLPPTAPSAALAARIRAERTLADQSRHAERHVGEPAFIGRIAERGRLLERLDQARSGRGGLALVLGESGIGKTRLLDELAAAAAWRGWKVAGGRAEETHTSAALTEALNNAIRGPRAHQLVRLVPAPLLAVAARVIPGLTPDLPPLPDTIGLEQLAAAIAAVLAGLGKIAPHLFVIDDVQWAAPDVWPLLDHLLPLLDAVPVLIVLAGRSDELRVQPSWRYIETWDAAGTPLVHLAGLTPGELAALVRASTVEAPAPEHLARLAAASNGNPLIALTLLRADALSDDTPPPSLTNLVDRRLALLAPEPRRAVQAAAVLGTRIDYALWEALLGAAGLPPEALPPLAGELERSGFLALAEADYRFVHDTLRAAIYARLLDASKRRWHAHALAATLRLRPGDKLTRLYHAEGANDAPAIAAAALAAGDQALQSLAPTSATRFFTQALAALPPTALDARYTALLGRMRANTMLADTAAQQRDLAELAAIAAKLADPQRKLDVLRQHVELAWTLGTLEHAAALATDGLSLARELGDAASEAALLEAAGRIARHGGHYDRAEQLFIAARDRYTALHDPLGEAVTTDLLGGVTWSRGAYAEAAQLHATAAEQFHALGATYHEARALNKLGSAYWGLGDFIGARATHERSLIACRAIGDRLGESDNLDNLGGVAWVLGDYPTAISFYEQALALRRAAANAWGISISLGNLGSAYRLLGDDQTALAKYDEALAINRTMGRRPGQGYVQNGRGLVFLKQGRLAEAREALEEAYAIHCALNAHDTRIDSCGSLALLHLAEGDCAAARRMIDEGLTMLRSDDRAPLRQWVHYVAARVCTAEDRRPQAIAHLQQAHQAMQHSAAVLPPPEQAAFLSRVPLNRDVQAALDAMATTAGVRLVRAGTPLGRSLTPDDYVTITWTIATPADDLITPAEARRRAVIARLIAEAQAQGGIPTDDDLAAALGVSRRTILRDMATLQAQGVNPPTRRRKAP
jgi:DNA-binding SARP family transcriptional activator